ncbi:response regulator [Photobacterium kishitanii]|uniref:Response regulator n=1 Tax=Photobacterium kishitanii TaxID=318456 RepID=A0A0B7JAS1_9GAMM|nr:response regulator [Photobacterium kishitanii]OBU27769.1 two-component system response regulator [Photobacterium kishitanii]PSU92782.1 response regulator [Photobacterium kishitanii]PSU95351.1 response regulator [Photobacterium kishitanii]PSU97697.1 response regulator [Photobacterium kishitanii]PSV23037.1 response regulator [Photobacterium kishitanii]
MLAGKNILIVEDDPVFRTMIVGFLNSQGCQVREAEDGLAGLKALKDDIPDLLLCDLAMPIMTGMEFVEEVALQYPMIPVIVISGTGNMTDVAQALRLGVKDFLIKPIDNIMTLKSAIVSVLKMQDSAQQKQQDFSQRWVTDGDDSGLVEEELQWHISELKNDPQAARELLMGLMPDLQSRCGRWKLSYRALQSADMSPVIFDYIWLIDGQLAFYMVDTSSGGENSTATALLIRACFNDFLRRQGNYLSSVQHLVAQIELGLKYSGYATPVKGLFGVFNLAERQLHLIAAGIGGKLQVSEQCAMITAGQWLGDDACNNPLVILPMSDDGGRLSLSDINHANFSVNFETVI